MHPAPARCTSASCHLNIAELTWAHANAIGSTHSERRCARRRQLPPPSPHTATSRWCGALPRASPRLGRGRGRLAHRSHPGRGCPGARASPPRSSPPAYDRTALVREADG
eukprot:scaffold2053_cov342-Prasinococcus_capsulatus_cf.AAC.3